MIFSVALILIVAGLSLVLGYRLGRNRGRKDLKQWVTNHACYQCQENFSEQLLTPEEWDHLR